MDEHLHIRREGVGIGITHNMPVAKMAVTINFRLRGICNFHIGAMGSTEQLCSQLLSFT